MNITQEQPSLIVAPYQTPTNEEIKLEIEKCKPNPYYFATKYIKVNGEKFFTPLTEEQFNIVFKL